jgi:hypothetical protein
MRRLTAIALAIALTAAAAAGLMAGQDEPQVAPRGVDVSDGARSPLPGERALSARPETRKAVGRFALRGGRALEVRTLQTTDGLACLVDVETPSLVGGSTCHDGDLFAAGPVVFSINSDGGPARFSDEYLVGLAAPEIALVSIEKTNGSRVDARPNMHGAFVVESSPRELRDDVHPAVLRAYADGGALVETIELSPPR